MKKPLIALLHVGYWFVFFLLSAMMMYAFSEAEEVPESVDEEVLAAAYFFIIFLPAVVSFYFFYWLLFPRYFRRKKIGKAFLLGVGLAVSTTALGFTFVSVVLYPECGKETNISEATSFVVVAGYFNLVGGIIAFVIKGFSTWFEEVRLKEALQEKNHAMELALVKSQLDPHFLFNTINNIDVLILKDPEQASEFLNRLSDIMRFMLYETKTERISLDKEIDYIKKYIALQKIRTANESYVDFQLIGDPTGHRIAPMAFIPFVENAFKHTRNKKAEDAIRVSIEVSSENMTFRCVNKLSPTEANLDDRSGLGNDLIRKRLQLLYPGQHQLQSGQQGDEYHVLLKLEN